MVPTIFRYVLLKNNSSEIWHLQRRREVTKQNLIESEQTTKNLILQLAEQTRQLIELGGLSIPIDHISSYITTEMREAGWTEHQIDYIRQVLPNEYKNLDKAHPWGTCSPDSVYDRTDELLDTITEEMIDQMSDTSVKILYQKKKDKTAERSRRDRLTLHMLQEKAAERNIVLENEDKINGIHHQEPQNNPLSEKIQHVADLFGECHHQDGRISKKAIEAPPQDDKRMEELIDSLTPIELYNKNYIDWRTPLSDEKWSFGLYTWGKIAYYYTEQGKHAAAKSRNLAKISLSAYGMNEERGLTREQVGDRFSYVFNKWVQMAKTIQVVMNLEKDPSLQTYDTLVSKGYGKDDIDKAFQKLFDSTSAKMQQYPLFRHFITLDEKWHYPDQTVMIAHRKYRMHDKLSELA